MYKMQPPEKSHPLFPSNPLLKIEILGTPPPFFFERLVGGSFPQQRGRGVHYVAITLINKTVSTNHRANQSYSRSSFTRIICNELKIKETKCNFLQKKDSRKKRKNGFITFVQPITPIVL